MIGDCYLTMPEISNHFFPFQQVIESTGPTNTRMYTVAVYFRESRLASATGHSIQEAEMNAANSALASNSHLFPHLSYQKKVLERNIERQSIEQKKENWKEEVREYRRRNGLDDKYVKMMFEESESEPMNTKKNETVKDLPKDNKIATEAAVAKDDTSKTEPANLVEKPIKSPEKCEPKAQPKNPRTCGPKEEPKLLSSNLNGPPEVKKINGREEWKWKARPDLPERRHERRSSRDHYNSAKERGDTRSHSREREFMSYRNSRAADKPYLCDRKSSSLPEAVPPGEKKSRSNGISAAKAATTSVSSKSIQSKITVIQSTDVPEESQKKMEESDKEEGECSSDDNEDETATQTQKVDAPVSHGKMKASKNETSARSCLVEYKSCSSSDEE